MNLPPAVFRTSIRMLVRPVLAARLPVGVQRAWLRAATAAGPSAPGVVRDAGLLGARPAEIHTPSETNGRAVLYLHGGAFTLGGPAVYRALCSHLAAATGARVHVLDYRRAPEHPYPAALDDALAAYADLLARGVPARDLAVVGDSAGGWLALATALATALARRDRDGGLGPLGLISPWVDLTVPPASWDTDTLLSASWLRRSAAAYLRGTDPADPRVDLTTADLTGLPATTVQVGGDEALLGEARALTARLTAAGVDATLQELPGLWHVAQAQAGLTAPATAAVRQLGAALWH